MLYLPSILMVFTSRYFSAPELPKLYIPLFSGVLTTHQSVNVALYIPSILRALTTQVASKREILYIPSILRALTTYPI